MDSTFWLSEYQKTLELDKGLAKGSKARKTALSSLQVDLHLPTNSDEKLASYPRKQLSKQLREEIGS